MAETLRPTNVTREAWGFITDHFSSLIKIAAIPLVLAIAFDGFIEIYYSGAPSPYTKAGVDIFYAVLEAMWGVRWLRYLLEPPRQNKYFMAPFRFGRHEIKYALYSLVLCIPIILDDIILGIGLPGIIKTGMFCFLFAFALVIFRFEFIFPAIAISHSTSFSVSWHKSKAYWGSMLISLVQASLIMIPLIALLCIIGFILFIAVWAFGLADVSDWTFHNGFNTLFIRSPAILGIYLFVKETSWLLFQALILTYVGLYYRDASVKIVSRK